MTQSGDDPRAPTPQTVINYSYLVNDWDDDIDPAGFVHTLVGDNSAQQFPNITSNKALCLTLLLLYYLAAVAETKIDIKLSCWNLLEVVVEQKKSSLEVIKFMKWLH